MDNSRKVMKELYIGIAVTVVFFAILGAFFIRPIWLYEVSLLVGGSMSCLFLYQMYDCLDRALDMQSKSAKQFVTVRVLLRLIVRAALLVGSIMIHWACFVGVTVGLLATKISAYINPFVKRRLGHVDEETKEK